MTLTVELYLTRSTAAFLQIRSPEAQKIAKPHAPGHNAIHHRLILRTRFHFSGRFPEPQEEICLAAT